MTPLSYARQQLAFSVGEWNTLTTADQSDIKQWAREEMERLGIEIK